MDKKREFEVEQFIRRLEEKNKHYNDELESQIRSWYSGVYAGKWPIYSFENDSFFLNQKKRREELYWQHSKDYSELKQYKDFPNWEEVILREERFLANRHEQERQKLYKELNEECKKNKKPIFNYNYRYTSDYQVTKSYIFTVYSPTLDLLARILGSGVGGLILLYMIFTSNGYTVSIFFQVLKFMIVVFPLGLIYSVLRYAKVSVSMKYDYLEIKWVSKISLYYHKPVQFKWEELESYSFTNLKSSACSKFTLYLKNKRKFKLYEEPKGKKNDYLSFYSDFRRSRPEPGMHLIEKKERSKGFW